MHCPSISIKKIPDVYSNLFNSTECIKLVTTAVCACFTFSNMNNCMCISGVIYSTGECCHTIEYSSPRRVTPFEYSSPKFATRFSPTSVFINDTRNPNLAANGIFGHLFKQCLTSHAERYSDMNGVNLKLRSIHIK